MGVPYEQTLGAARDRARRAMVDEKLLVLLEKIEDDLGSIADALHILIRKEGTTK